MRGGRAASQPSFLLHQGCPQLPSRSGSHTSFFPPRCLEPLGHRAPSGRAGLCFLGTLSCRKTLEPTPAPSGETLQPGGQHCPLGGSSADLAPARSLVLGTFWLLRGPWPVIQEEGPGFFFFPVLQPAAIVEKVNTPYSLTGKSSSQEWEEIKSQGQPRQGEPQGPVCAAGTLLGAGAQPRAWPSAPRFLFPCLLPPSLQMRPTGIPGVHQPPAQL